jgi:hypothetical protein
MLDWLFKRQERIPDIYLRWAEELLPEGKAGWGYLGAQARKLLGLSNHLPAWEDLYIFAYWTGSTWSLTVCLKSMHWPHPSWVLDNEPYHGRRRAVLALARALMGFEKDRAEKSSDYQALGALRGQAQVENPFD